jgi:hypothetical protein
MRGGDTEEGILSSAARAFSEAFDPLATRWAASTAARSAQFRDAARRALLAEGSILETGTPS